MCDQKKRKYLIKSGEKTYTIQNIQRQFTKQNKEIWYPSLRNIIYISTVYVVMLYVSLVKVC